MYTELDLRKMKGQALKDIWHELIGKPPGLKNTTGLKNSEEILQAILKLQGVKEAEPDCVERMPPKGKPKTIPAPPAPLHKGVQAVETMDHPLASVEVERIRLRKLHLHDRSYYLNVSSNDVYEANGSTPGDRVGTWNPATRTIDP